MREPHVSVEAETYRPFFILGEVTTPGQYPYVADMTVEKAIAIAGGFAPRASKKTVELTRSASGRSMKGEVPLSYPLRPGDTVLVKERWFRPSCRPGQASVCEREPETVATALSIDCGVWVPAFADDDSNIRRERRLISSYACRGIPACGSRRARRRPC